MNIAHWMRKEDSGLVRSTLEIAAWEEKAGHAVSVREPSTGNSLYGGNGPPDLHCIHSQINVETYHDGKPKIMWMHGEPLSSVSNLHSMRAIVDLCPLVECFICMRREEVPVWSSLNKKTYCVPKGVDLEVYKPLDKLPEGEEPLSGEPAVLYCENWRGERNPLYLCAAMKIIRNKLPKARLHLYNCTHPKMYDAFKVMHDCGKWWTFLRTLKGPVENINLLYNKAHIVFSALNPLYARVIEAFGAGRAAICPGYREPGYPYTCDVEVNSIADAIMNCWENYDKMDYRKWAEERHDVKKSAEEAVRIYERYL